MKKTVVSLIAVAWIVAGILLWIKVGKLAAMAVDFISDIAWCAAILSSGYATGRALLAALKKSTDGILSFVIEIAVGLIVFIAILLLAGSVGFLHRMLVLAIVAVPLIASYRHIVDFIEERGWEKFAALKRFSRFEIFTMAIIGLSFVVAAINVVIPEAFYDALYYHDAFPALYLIRHKIEIYPNAVHSAMPSNIDLLYAMPLAFGGTGAVRAMHFAFYIGVALWIYLISEKQFGREAGFAGAAVWATIPGPGLMAGLGAVDLGVTFFAIGAAGMLLEWIFGKGEKRDLVLSAVFLGVAVGSKYSALMIGAVCAIAVIAGAIKKRRQIGAGGAIKAVVVYGAISLAIASPWYIRAYMVTGDPLYPAMSKAGTDGAIARDNLARDSERLYPASKTFTSLPVALFKQQGQLGVGSALGLAAFLFLPALIRAFARRGAAAWIAVGIVALYAMWSRSILIVRYLYPALALGSIIAGELVVWMWADKIRRPFVAAFIAIACFAGIRSNIQYYEAPQISGLKYLTMSRSPGEYLEIFTASYKPGQFCDAELPLNAKLLFVGETMGFYYQRDYLPVSGYDRHPLGIWISESQDAPSLRAKIAAMGFTHIVVNRSEWKRLSEAYGYLKLGDEDMKKFDEMAGSLKQVYGDKRVQIYQLQ